MSNLTRRQAALLAALLDADGAVVRYADLGDVVGTSGVDDAPAIRLYVHRLRRLGVECVAVVRGVGLRMASLPPDWALDDVLRELDAMRRAPRSAPVAVWRRAS